MKFPDIFQCEEPVFHIRGDGFISKNRSADRAVDVSKDIVVVIPEGPEGQQGPLLQGQRDVCFKMHGTGTPETTHLDDSIIAEHEYHKGQNRCTITYYGLKRTPDQSGQKYEVEIKHDEFDQVSCSWTILVNGRWRPANSTCEGMKIKLGDGARRFMHSKKEVEEMRMQEREKVTVSKRLNMKFTCRDKVLASDGIIYPQYQWRMVNRRVKGYVKTHVQALGSLRSNL